MGKPSKPFSRAFRKGLLRPHSQRFMATIYKIWMMRHVDVPQEIGAALAKEFASDSKRAATSEGAATPDPKPELAQGAHQEQIVKKRKGTSAKPGHVGLNTPHIPVIATVNGRSTRTTLAPAGAGRYRLQINTELRKAAGADAGDLIGVELKLDRESREIAVPPELRAVLKDHAKARKEFGHLPPGHRRQLLLYYLRAKSAKAREHVTRRFIDHLVERAILGGSKRDATRPAR